MRTVEPMFKNFDKDQSGDIDRGGLSSSMSNSSCNVIIVRISSLTVGWCQPCPNATHANAAWSCQSGAAHSFSLSAGVQQQLSMRTSAMSCKDMAISLSRSARIYDHHHSWRAMTSLLHLFQTDECASVQPQKDLCKLCCDDRQ